MFSETVIPSHSSWGLLFLCPADDEHGHVSALWGVTDKLVDGPLDILYERLGSRIHLQGLKSSTAHHLLSVLLEVVVLGLGQSVAVEEEHDPFFKGRLLSRKLKIRPRTHRHVLIDGQVVDLFIQHQRSIVSGIAIGQLPGSQVEHTDKERYAHIFFHRSW